MDLQTVLHAQGGGLLGMLTPLLDRDRDRPIVDDLGGLPGKFRT